MSVDTRNAGWVWEVRTHDNTYKDDKHYRMASLAVLMDIRDEMRRLNAVFACPNFLAVPHRLAAIEKNTRNPRRKAAKKR